VHEIEVYIIKSEIIQTLLETLFDAGVERAPQLGGDEQVLALDDAGVNGLLDTLADLIFIAVAKSSVNVTVSNLDGVGDSPRDFAGLGLPCSQAEGGDLCAGVELETSIAGSHCERFVKGRLFTEEKVQVKIEDK
jgi:hypothetical protein